MWTLKDLSAPDDVWVVFKSHRDVSVAFVFCFGGGHVLRLLPTELCRQHF